MVRASDNLHAVVSCDGTSMRSVCGLQALDMLFLSMPANDTSVFTTVVSSLAGCLTQP